MHARACVRSRLHMLLDCFCLVIMAEDRVRSDVWKWITKIPEKNNRVQCNICSKELAYSGGTTNLCEHLVSKHSLQYQPASKSTCSAGYT